MAVQKSDRSERILRANRITRNKWNFASFVDRRHSGCVRFSTQKPLHEQVRARKKEEKAIDFYLSYFIDITLYKVVPVRKSNGNVFIH